MNADSYLRRTLIVLLCLVPCIPLIVANPLFFPFITGKNFAFRIIVEIAFALWAILALKDASMRPRWSSLPIVILAFLVSAGISAFLAENPGKAFWSNFERMEGWIGLLHSTAYFFVLWLTMNSEKLWGRFWNTSIAVSFAIGLFGLMQLGGMFAINQGGVRVDGTLGNATYLAVYMLFHVFITLVYLVKSWKTESWLRYLYIPAIVLQTIMIFYSATRGTILGLLGGLFLAGLVMVFMEKNNQILKKWGIGLIAVLFVIAGTFFAIKDTPFVQNHEVLSRIAGISLEHGQTRFAIWNMAFKGFLERPVFGWGQEGYNYIFNKFYDSSLHSQEPWFDRAHNAFLDWLVAGGAVGFLLYCSFYAFTMWLLWRPKSEFSVFEKGLLTGLVAAYTFHNMFVFDNLVSYMFFMSILAYITFRSSQNTAPDSTGKPVSENIALIARPALVVVVAAFFYFVNVPGIMAAGNLIQGLSQHATIAENFDYFKKANETKGLGRQEVREQLVQFAVMIRELKAGDQAFQDEVALYAVESMYNEIARAPNDTRLYMFLGSFWRQVGNYEESLKNLTRAHELSPTKQQILFELAILENNHGNLPGALAYFKQAYDLFPEYESARIFYAAALIRVGDTTQASELLIEKWETVTPDNDYILQAYFDVKDFEKVLTIAKGRIDKNPENSKLHIQLAAAYLGAEDRRNAISALQKAIELDPSFKQQGEYYIQEIQAGRNP